MTTYKMGILSDLHHSIVSDRTSIANVIHSLFLAEKVNCALMLGDIVDADSPGGRAENQALINALVPIFENMPTWWTIGNHDLEETSLSDFIIDASVFVPGQNFTFDLGKWRIICFDSVEPSRFSASSDTITWLGSQLTKAQADRKYIIIASHTGQWQNWPGNPASWTLTPTYEATVATPSDITGPITITTNSSAFAAGDVGKVLSIRQDNGGNQYWGTATITNYNTVTNVTATVDTDRPFYDTSAGVAWFWVSPHGATSYQGYSFYSYNSSAIRAVIEAAKTAGADIKTVICGHGHSNATATVNNITYYEFKSAYDAVANTCAIMSLEDDGTYRIAGAYGQTSYNSPFLFVDDVNGLNTNTGRMRNLAWKTITYAGSAVSPARSGDTITIMPGTYRQSTSIYGYGTPLSPIIFTFESGAKMTGTEIFSSFYGPDTNGWYVASTVPWINTVLENGTTLPRKLYSAAASVGAWDYYSTSLFYLPTSGIPSSYMVEAGSRDSCFTFYSNANNIIINNAEIYGSNKYALDISDYCSGITINDCHSYGCGSGGCRLSNRSDWPTTINRFKTHHHKKSGIEFSGVAATGSVYINYLLVYANSIVGIGCYGSQMPTINNAVSYNSSTGISIGQGAKPFIYNSISTNNATYQVSSYGAGFGSIINSCISGPVSWGNTTSLNIIATNPQFVNPASNDFHLQRTSPCIDAGSERGLSRDFEGNWVYGTDIGAYEYKTTNMDTWYGTMAEVMTKMAASGPSLLARPGTRTEFISANSIAITFEK